MGAVLGFGCAKITSNLFNRHYLRDTSGSGMKKRSYHRHLRLDGVKLFSIGV